MGERWKIAKWSEDQVFVEGPVILPNQDGLVGMEWVKAATREVVPAEHADALAEAVEEIVGIAEDTQGWAVHAGARHGIRDRAHTALTAYRQATPASTGKESER